jgi:hypothetical protein
MRGNSNSNSNTNGFWGLGLLFLIFGGAGIAEFITSGHGSFIVSATVFSIGFGFILGSYIK